MRSPQKETLNREAQSPRRTETLSLQRQIQNRSRTVYIKTRGGLVAGRSRRRTSESSVFPKALSFVGRSECYLRLLGDLSLPSQNPILATCSILQFPERGVRTFALTLIKAYAKFFPMCNFYFLFFFLTFQYRKKRSKANRIPPSPPRCQPLPMDPVPLMLVGTFHGAGIF